MLSFACDYSEGAHPEILRRLAETNLEQLPGYGMDHYADSARIKIRDACSCPQADVWFLSGGTQTNAVVISSMLSPWEGVISAETGHIGCHEAGAIEYSGHKVLTLPEYEGKLRASDLQAYLKSFYADENHDHMVFPGMVYLTHPTEYGTLYSRNELEAISRVCEACHLPLYLDGARLGYGLASRGTDLDLPAIAELCSVFYIGGTKVGALCGEAVVFTKNNTPDHFMTRIKQQGALLAKGRLLSIQFDTLFTDGLYLKISRHAIEMAELLKETFVSHGYPLFINSPTNQQFIVLEDEQSDRLKRLVDFSFWEKKDDTHTVVRFATSWATEEEDIRQLGEMLDAVGKD